MKIKMLKQLAITGVIVACAASLQATPTLRLSTDGGTTWTTITDQDVIAGPGEAVDTGVLPGVVTFNGSLGGNWTVNVTTGITKPVMGTAARPSLDLNSVNVSTLGAGSLIIEFSETDFGPTTTGNPIAMIGGTTHGTVLYRTYADAGNTLFGTGTSLTTLGTFGPGAFSGTSSGPAFPNAPYSLTQRVTITHTGIGTTSFDAALEVPEGGTTLVLLGAGLSVLAFARRKMA